MNDNGKYDDIINMPHHVSKKHPQMSIEMRSAQFAPFAALTGYEEAVKETGRLTNSRIDIDEELKTDLDEKLRLIQEKITIQHMKPEVNFTYFVPDLKKDGGKYVTITGKVIKIDEYKHTIMVKYKLEEIEEVVEIKISEIINIEII